MTVTKRAALKSHRGHILRMARWLSLGLNLQDFGKQEGHTLGELANFYYFPDGTAHKNRMQGNDFVQSVMYRRGVTCFDCHDVHRTGNYAQLRKPPDQLCLDCQGRHSMRCLPHAGDPNRARHFHPRSHVRFISPSITEKYKILALRLTQTNPRDGRRTSCAIGTNVLRGVSGKIVSRVRVFDMNNERGFRL